MKEGAPEAGVPIAVRPPAFPLLGVWLAVCCCSGQASGARRLAGLRWWAKSLTCSLMIMGVDSWPGPGVTLPLFGQPFPAGFPSRLGARIRQRQRMASENHATLPPATFFCVNSLPNISQRLLAPETVRLNSLRRSGILTSRFVCPTVRCFIAVNY